VCILKIDVNSVETYGFDWFGDPDDTLYFGSNHFKQKQNIAGIKHYI
jgi:hypothetical protein